LDAYGSTGLLLAPEREALNARIAMRFDEMLSDGALDQARALAVRDTRRYAKRQFTWARHQMPEFAWVAPEGAEAAGERAFAPN
jgi:tRNA dimethylallyltransferase